MHRKKKNHRIFLILSFLLETIKLLAVAAAHRLVNPVEVDMNEYAANLSKHTRRQHLNLVLCG